jgi:hypothetical protein
MIGLYGEYIDKADACFVQDCFVFEKFALFWIFLNIEECERDCTSFSEREYTQANRRHPSSDFLSEEINVVGALLKFVDVQENARLMRMLSEPNSGVKRF